MTYSNIVILTGAGISAESGLRTFRDSDGLWEDHSIEEVATPEGYRANPDLVQRFYSERRLQLQEAAPNKAHTALGRLETEVTARGGQVTVVTQNVDNLHEQGGSTRVLHMHGELQKVRCQSCGAVHRWVEACDQKTPCPACGAPALRPHIVWFGEIPFYMEEIEGLLSACDLFVSIGTSGTVYPAAGFVAMVRGYGRAHTLELNLEPSDGASMFKEARHGPASALVPAFVDEILGETP